jgi:hypothetical protein
MLQVRHQFGIPKSLLVCRFRRTIRGKGHASTRPRPRWILHAQCACAPQSVCHGADPEAACNVHQTAGGCNLGLEPCTCVLDDTHADIMCIPDDADVRKLAGITKGLGHTPTQQGLHQGQPLKIPQKDTQRRRNPRAVDGPKRHAGQYCLQPSGFAISAGPRVIHFVSQR